MKIIKLTAENVKKLRAVEITPSGEIITIAGKNGAGKTSVLDAIWWAVAGTTHIQAQPIRKGQNKARIRLDLGDLIVERRFTPAGSTLTVENAAGARFPSPQKMLDALLGELSFDPLAFARMTPRQQFDELRAISKLDVDIDQLDALNKGDYGKRTDLNRDAKAKRAQAEGISIPAGDPASLIDESALIDELQKAGEINTEIETRKARREQEQADANSNKTAGINARNKAAKLRDDAEQAFAKAKRDMEAAYQRSKDEAEQEDKNASEALTKAAEIEKKIDASPALPKAVDVTALRQKIEQTRAANAATTERQQAVERKAKAIEEAKALEATAKALTEGMEAREKAKADAIARAKLPVPGLGFGDGIVTHNDIPFDQASTAEQLQVSLSIAMAANPRLRVIRIQDGSLLDDDSMAAIAEMAKAGDYQIWIERVDTTSKIGIVIDDGAVIAVDGQAVESNPETEAA